MSTRILLLAIALYCLQEIGSLPLSSTEKFLPSDDMILLPEQREWLMRGPRSRSEELNHKIHQWPDGIVYYNIDPYFALEQKYFIGYAMSLIQEKSCIRFLPADCNMKAYVYFVRHNSDCSSNLGYIGTPQPINLAYGCFGNVATIVHEIMHALGFVHEHATPDRDKYVIIHKENVQPEKWYNFLKYANGTVSDYGVGYDYGSLMHYDGTAFSSNGEATMEPVEAGVTLGSLYGMSSKDVKKLNLMYKC